MSRVMARALQDLKARIARGEEFPDAFSAVCDAHKLTPVGWQRLKDAYDRPDEPPRRAFPRTR